MVVTWQCPTKQILISVHSMFPLVYVWVRQWGAWKLHLYNSNAQKFIYYHMTCPFGSILNMLHNLAIMVALQIAPRTRINWLRPASTIAIHHNARCPQISCQHNMVLLTLFLLCLGWWHHSHSCHWVHWQTAMALEILRQGWGSLGSFSFLSFLAKREWQLIITVKLWKHSLTGYCFKCFSVPPQVSLVFRWGINTRMIKKISLILEPRCTPISKIDKTANEN